MESLIVLEVVCNKEFVEEIKFEKVGLIDMVNSLEVEDCCKVAVDDC